MNLFCIGFLPLTTLSSVFNECKNSMFKGAAETNTQSIVSEKTDIKEKQCFKMGLVLKLNTPKMASGNLLK